MEGGRQKRVANLYTKVSYGSHIHESTNYSQAHTTTISSYVLMMMMYIMHTDMFEREIFLCRGFDRRKREGFLNHFIGTWRKITRTHT